MSVDALGVRHGYQARRKGLGAPETRSSSPLRVDHPDDEITARWPSSRHVHSAQCRSGRALDWISQAQRQRVL